MAAEFRGNRFSAEAGMLFRIGLEPAGMVVGACEAGISFEVGLGLAEAAVEP